IAGIGAAVAALSERQAISGEFCPITHELKIAWFGFPLVQFVPCANTAFEVKLWPMKLRYDLAMKVTPKMALAEAQANQHRYKAEPLFSKTGTGSLSSASTKDSAAEAE